MEDSIAEVICTHLADALRYHRLGSLFLAGFEFAKATTLLEASNSGAEAKQWLKLEKLVDAVGEGFQQTFLLFEEPVAPPRKAYKSKRANKLTSQEARRQLLTSIEKSRIRNHPAAQKLKERWESERK